MYKPHAIFINQSRDHNKGRNVNLIRASESQFAGFFYAMHRGLRCRNALEATVHSAAWSKLQQLQPVVIQAANNVKDGLFWKRIYILLRALFPLLKLLRLTDSNTPNMDKVYFLLHKACDHLEKSKKYLLDENLFPETISINGQDKGDATDDEDEDEDEDADNRDEDDDKVMDQYPSEDISDKDVYTKEDEWETLFTDESDGIFKKIVNTVGE